MTPDPKSNRPEPLHAATRAEENTTASEDQGAEAATANERKIVADDYEANARVDDADREDFPDETDVHDRPDSALIAKESGEA